MSHKAFNADKSAAMKKELVTSGTQVGKWALFDRSAGLSNVTIGSDRFSARLLPGHGLIEPSDDDMPFEPAR